MLLIALVFLFTPTPVAHATTFTVTNLSDSGVGSLRQAIDSANAAAGADTISFSVSGTIVLNSTLPSVTDAAGLTIDGTGQAVTISGNHLVGVLMLGPGASLTLNNLTIADGYASEGGAGIVGGGTLTVTNSIFSGNNGNAIYTVAGTLDITNSTFSGNTATSSVTSGGGIASSTPLTITNSTFVGNSASNSASSGGGGAIWISGWPSPVIATITNSTFSGNTANYGAGGGIWTSNTAMTVTNSTFSGNSANPGYGDGAVIYRWFADTFPVTLRNTIVANSTAGGNCAGTIINGGNNIDDGTSCGWTTTNGSKSSTNPLLGPLANNGGPTQTFALLNGSQAIDGVTFNAPNGAPSTDQRGVVRPQRARYDIGSFESPYSTHLPLIRK